MVGEGGGEFATAVLDNIISQMWDIAFHSFMSHSRSDVQNYKVKLRTTLSLSYNVNCAYCLDFRKLLNIRGRSFIMSQGVQWF